MSADIPRTLLGRFYLSILSGAIKKNHFFWAQLDGEVQSFDHCISMADRSSELVSSLHNKVRLTPPGLKPIKQVELWKKWGPLIPEDERDALCPKPPDNIISAVAKERTDNARRKRSL
jgi:hypothetical protein